MGKDNIQLLYVVTNYTLDNFLLLFEAVLAVAVEGGAVVGKLVAYTADNADPEAVLSTLLATSI